MSTSTWWPQEWKDRAYALKRECPHISMANIAAIITIESKRDCCRQMVQKWFAEVKPRRVA